MENFLEAIKTNMLNRAILQEHRTLKLRDRCISQNKNPKDITLFMLYVGELIGMTYMLEDVGMKEETKQFDWILSYVI